LKAEKVSKKKTGFRGRNVAHPGPYYDELKTKMKEALIERMVEQNMPIHTMNIEPDIAATAGTTTHLKELYKELKKERGITI
jgi:hypothetical protein